MSAVIVPDVPADKANDDDRRHGRSFGCGDRTRRASLARGKDDRKGKGKSANRDTHLVRCKRRNHNKQGRFARGRSGVKKARDGTSTAELRTQSSTFVDVGSGPNGRVKIWRFEGRSREDKSSARIRRADPASSCSSMGVQYSPGSMRVL